MPHEFPPAVTRRFGDPRVHMLAGETARLPFGMKFVQIGTDTDLICFQPTLQSFQWRRIVSVVTWGKVSRRATERVHTR